SARRAAAGTARRGARSEAPTRARGSPACHSLACPRPPPTRPGEEVGERQRVDDLGGSDPRAPGDAEAQLEVVEVLEPVGGGRDRNRDAELRRPPCVD